MERCPAHITAWALIYAAEWGDAVICARGENTQPFSDGIQLCSVALSQPIWLHLQSSWSHTRTLYLAVFIFIGQPWFMTIKVQNNWLTLDVFYKSCLGGKASAAKNAGKWVKTEGMHDVMPWEGAAESLQPSFYLCIFITGASLASYVWLCQVLVYTALARSCNF